VEGVLRGRAEIVAGVLGCLVLLVLVYGLRLPLLPGVYYALHQPGAVEQSEAKVRQTERLAARLAQGARGARVQEIAAEERRILSSITADPQKRDNAPLFLATFLAPYYDLLEKYARLAPLPVDSAQKEVRETESVTFPAMIDNLKKYHEKLLSEDVIDLEVARDMANLSTP
jgi:5-bromo-4-chloroindolyl phosphate hydrolysis protein